MGKMGDVTVLLNASSFSLGDIATASGGNQADARWLAPSPSSFHHMLGLLHLTSVQLAPCSNSHTRRCLAATRTVVHMASEISNRSTRIGVRDGQWASSLAS